LLVLECTDWPVGFPANSLSALCEAVRGAVDVSVACVRSANQNDQRANSHRSMFIYKIFAL